MTTTETANQMYNKQAAQVVANLTRLAAILETHIEAQTKNPRDWGYVGDLVYWNERLSVIVDAFVEDADPFAGIVDVPTNDGWDA